MQTIQFNEQGELCTTPKEVIPDLCTAPNRQQAQDALWQWVQPVLLACHRQMQPERVQALVVFYEQLEQLVNAVYYMRQEGPVAPATPPSSTDAHHD